MSLSHKQKFFLIGWIMAIALLIPGIPSAGIERHASPALKISKGVFLIADPRLNDPNFRESVILMTRHGGDGSIGVIVNRPTMQPLTDLLPDLPLPGKSSSTLFLGGPVSRTLLSWLIQTERPPQGMEGVLGNLYFSINAPPPAPLLKESKQLRVYTGYAGWGPGQLQAEIDRGDWRLLPADVSTIFQKDSETIWPELFRRSQERSVTLPLKKQIG
jgi:putative transcriptional regulator